MSAQTSMRRRRRVRKGPSRRTPHPDSQPRPSPPHHHRKLTPPRRSPPPSLSRPSTTVSRSGVAATRWPRANDEREIDRPLAPDGRRFSYVSTCVPSWQWRRMEELCYELRNGNHIRMIRRLSIKRMIWGFYGLLRECSPIEQSVSCKERND